MDNRPTPSEYQSAALPASSSYPSYPGTHIDQQGSEPSASTPPHPQAPPPDARGSYSSSATPTSEYSARTPTFGPDQQLLGSRYVDRYQPSSTSTSSGGMARSPRHLHPPALHHPPPPTIKPDPEVSEDSTVVAAPSPSFASPAGSHYGSQYPPAPHTMSEGYQQQQQHPSTPSQPASASASASSGGAGSSSGGWRQDWGPYGPSTTHPMSSQYGHSPSPTTMASALGMVSTARPVSAQKQNRKRAGDAPANSHPLSQVYSFVPIPGATQNKRPRRRFEEIERMYKCGWNGCEKAYGTLNHLNAHVTMQTHGAKRTPDGNTALLTLSFSPPPHAVPRLHAVLPHLLHLSRFPTSPSYPSIPSLPLFPSSPSRLFLFFFFFFIF